jgi:hypothetical protein
MGPFAFLSGRANRLGRARCNRLRQELMAPDSRPRSSVLDRDLDDLRARTRAELDALDREMERIAKEQGREDELTRFRTEERERERAREARDRRLRFERGEPLEVHLAKRRAIATGARRLRPTALHAQRRWRLNLARPRPRTSRGRAVRTRGSRRCTQRARSPGSSDGDPPGEHLTPRAAGRAA